MGKFKKMLLESEYDNSKSWENMQDIKRMTYAMKCFVLIACVIIFTSSFSGLMSLVGGAPATINYNFENDILYDDSLPEVSNEFNIRNKTAGHYPATYSFENETGLENLDISIVDSLLSTELVDIIDFLDGHDTVLRLSDYSNVNYAGVVNIFSSSQVSGTIELWFRTTNVTATTWICTGRDGAGYSFFTQVSQGYFRYYDGGYQNVQVINNNIWYHLKLTFDGDTDTISIWINGILQVDDESIAGFDAVDRININTLDTGVNYYSYVDAVGYSWDVNESKLDSYNIVQGVYVSGAISDTYTNNSQLLVIDSELGVMDEDYSIGIVFYFDDVDIEGYLDVYINCSLIPGLYYLKKNTVLIGDSDTTEIAIKDLWLTDIDYLNLIIISDDFFTISIDLINILIEANYEIGDNLWISEMIPTNEVEVDKWEFVSNSTGDFYVDGEDNIEGRSVDETNGDIYIASDEGFDKKIIFEPTSDSAQLDLTNTYLDNDFNLTDYIEYGFSLKLDGFASVINEFSFVMIPESGNAFYLWVGIGPGEYFIYWKNYSAPGLGETIIGYNKYSVTGIDNMIIDFNFIAYNGTYLIQYNDSIPYYHDNLPNLFGNPTSEREFSFISGPLYSTRFRFRNYISSTYSAEIGLDYDYLYLNGDSLANEVIPDNVFILSNEYISLNEYNFLEITFNYDFDELNVSTIGNNVSIYINDDVHIIDYDELYINGYRKLLYLEGPFNGFYFRIYNSSEFEITNIKLYGIKLVNELTSEKYYLEFDYSSINIDESYFWVDSSNRLQYSLTTNDANLEYISASFNIVDLASMNRSIAFSHQKSNVLAFSEFRVLYTDTTYSSFFSTVSVKSVNTILPQNKVIGSFYVLITDNDNDLSSTLTGYFSSISLIYYPDIETTISTLSLIGIIPLLILLVVIPFLMYMKFKNAIVVIPTFILMTIIGIATGLLPNWVGAVLIVGSIFTYLIKKEVME